jgi:hypothetical protein
VFGGQTPYPLPLGPKDYSQRPLQINIPQPLFRLIGGADQPESPVLQATHSAGQVDDFKDRNRLGSPASYRTNGFGHTYRSVSGDHNCIRSGGVGGTKARPQVVRILNTIQDED